MNANAPIDVRLTSSEYLQAMQVGIMRACQDRRDGRGHTYKARPEEAEMFDIRGAVGEAIVAKYLNIFWLGVGTFGGDDVGAFQVRSTGWRGGALRLHPKDDDNKAYISVYVCEGRGRIYGWLWGHEGKQEQYWSDPTGKDRPAFFVPASELRDMASLPRMEVDAK